MKTAVVFLLSVLTTISVHGAEVNFGNRVFKVATVGDCTDNDYTDAKNTGSLLFSRKVNRAVKTMTMDIQLVHYVPHGANCFRAHPALVQCVQAAFSQLKRHNKQAWVMSGYKLPSSLGSNPNLEDRFAAAGTAIELFPQSRSASDLLSIAQAVLNHCPAIMERIQRNVGVVMKSSSVHVFMGGPTDPPFFKVRSGYTLHTDATFTTEALAAITAGLEMGKRASDCTRFPQLSSGEMYPTTVASAESTVGEMDIAINRVDTDFKKMVMYLGTTVEFVNSEAGASWCGSPSGPACVDCKTGPLDVTMDKRCTARIMSPRMRDVLILLQKLTAQNMGDSIKVLQAWDEDYDGHTADASSLYREGRALTVALSSGSTGAALNSLAQLAVCARADFVKNEGNQLVIAVQKQYGDSPTEIQFPIVPVVRVEVPHSKAYLTELPSFFTDADYTEFPVFDSAGKEDMVLAPHTTMGMFKSSQTRYMRLSPSVALCYSKIQDYFDKRNDTDGLVTVEVVRGFMTTPERDFAFTSTDHRYTSANLGLSFEIRADNNVTLASLARLAVTLCTPVFQTVDQQIGVGLFNDRVFVDMRDEFLFWNPSGGFTPNVKNAQLFKVYIKELFEAAADERIVNPDVPSEADLLAEPTLRQNVDYMYEKSERIKRRKQDAVDPTECQPTSSTTFCSESASHQSFLATKGWAEAAKKHNYHDHNETRHAFMECTNTCGTCSNGLYWNKKLEACSNYLHWSPYEMAPDGTAINLFPRERSQMRKCACQGSAAHCIEDSALFLLFVNLIEGKWRADPLSSVEQEIYPQTENPSPLAELLNQLYATHHEGVAKIWVQDETDISAMRSTLEKLMLYNPNTTLVKFYVNETNSKEGVDSNLRSLIQDWTTGGSLAYTREYVAPFTIEDLAPNCKITSKRSAQQHSERDMLIGKINALPERSLRFDL